MLNNATEPSTAVMHVHTKWRHISKRGRKWFGDRLKALGYKSYRQYLSSEHWVAVKERYRKSKKPQHCVCCGDPEYELHHVDYSRLNKERLADLLALCRSHHKKYHSYLRRHKELKLGDVKVILEAIK